MFNIIKTPRNYFTRELLHDSNVAFHCKKSLAAIVGGKLFGGSVLPAQYCPCGPPHGLQDVPTSYQYAAKKYHCSEWPLWFWLFLYARQHH